MNEAMSSGSTMRAVGVANYGPIENLEAREVPKPPKPTGRQMLVQVKGISVSCVPIYIALVQYLQHMLPA